MNSVISRALFLGAGLTGLISSSAYATRLETLSLAFQSGATFSGTVAFANDYTSVTGIDGILTGYDATDFSYVGGDATDHISWVLNPGYNYNYSSTPNVFATYMFDGTPGDFYSVNNVLTLTYDYTSAPTLVLAAVGDGNSVNYSDLAVSGGLSPVPLPAALPLFAVALLGLTTLANRKRSGAVST